VKGDFSRRTFDPRRHYSGVLMQQGRVQVDADWNEQHEIDRHRVETGARDLIGASGGQVDGAGFEISVHDRETLSIGPGTLYVDGILCQNEEPGEDEPPLLFQGQQDLPGDRAIELLPGDPDVGLVYLDVWERHETYLDNEGIREIALGGPDTATRSRTVWQAKVLQVKAETSNIAGLKPAFEKHVEITAELARLGDGEKEKLVNLRGALARVNNQILQLLRVDCDSPFEEEMSQKNPPGTGRLCARALPPASAESECVVPRSAGYERLENQLYRVEVHRGAQRDGATFKWSRDNGSVETAVLRITPEGQNAEILVRDLGRDETLGFAKGQYVELMDDSREQNGLFGPLMQIEDVATDARTITVKNPPGAPLGVIDEQTAREFHYRLRRWDSEGALVMEDGEFVDLEEGVQVQFLEGRYNTGDYWLIPARTATGRIEWPHEEVQQNGQVQQTPLPQPPAGIEHHYARLALVVAATVKDKRQLLVVSDCRRLFPPLTRLTGLYYLGGDGQEAGSGQALPRPLVVGVANGDRPVVGARVTFEVLAEDPEEYDGRLQADDQTGRVVTATTDGSGEARCLWTLATDRPSQQVRASLVGGTHLKIYFNANLSAAGEAVAESIQIQRVLLANEQPLRVDANVPVDALSEGIQAVCDDDSVVDEQTVGERPTCFVTLEMPFPLNAADQELWGEKLLGYQPLILAAKVSGEENVILWEPADEARAWLRDRLFQTVETTERILAHLTLRGNFIWDEKRPDAHLDGETFGILNPGGAEIELRLPSGDGRRGGDFEMWFWLVPQTLILEPVTLDRPEVTGGTQAVTGTVRIVGTSPAAGTLVELESNNPEIAPVPENVRIGAGQSSATFQINTRPTAAPATVKITATLGEIQHSVELVVRPPVLQEVKVNPPSVTGRTTPVKGTVILTGPAPAGGITVDLRSANEAVVKLQQSRVTVPAGATSADFTVNTEPVNTPTPVDIVASNQNIQRTATLTVQPPALTQMLPLNPLSVLGGATSQGAIQISSPAPAGFTVELRSTNPSLATVQANVTVPANSTSAMFTVNARPVPSTSRVSIVASRAGVERSAELTVQPPALVGFEFLPDTVPAFEGSTGTLKLNGPAPGGTTISLSPAISSAASYPSSVSVPAGATQITFGATGKRFFGSDRSVTVTATYSSGGSRSDTLTVLGLEIKDEGDFTSFGMLTAEGPAGPEEETENDTEEAPRRPFIRGDERPRVGDPLAKPPNEHKP
jgi:hypothetical protein